MLSKRFDEELILQKATEMGLITENVEPIFDGTFDDKLYYQTQIGWLLREPYDDEENGMPCGGGWSIPHDCFEKDDAWKQPTWKPIIYTMFGVLNNIHYDDMDDISPDNGMVDVLKHILYLNLSKMPGYHSSSLSELWDKYQIWKDVVKQQIEHYQPKIVICAGTFDYIKDDLAEDAVPIKEFPFGYEKGIYKTKDRYYIATYHPIQRSIKRELYVDSIIDAVNYIHSL